VTSRASVAPVAARSRAERVERAERAVRPSTADPGIRRDVPMRPGSGRRVRGTPAAVLLDLDGTLVDSIGFLYRTYRTFLADLGCEGTRREFTTLDGLALPEIVRTLRTAHRLPERAPALEARYRSLLEAGYPVHTRARRGAHALLAHLRRRGIRLALTTGARRDLVLAVLARRKWTGRFELVVTGQDVERGKPDPAIYRLALSRLGLLPSRCAAVEDSPSGVRAAAGAGLRVIGCSGPRREPELIAAGADLVARRLADVPALLGLSLPAGRGRARRGRRRRRGGVLA
jgi:HAD superfamily hydrolase (TIGR01509 family)